MQHTKKYIKIFKGKGDLLIMKKLIAKDLLDIKAVFLRPNEPFTVIIV